MWEQELGSEELGSGLGDQSEYAERLIAGGVAGRAGASAITRAVMRALRAVAGV